MMYDMTCSCVISDPEIRELDLTVDDEFIGT